MSVKSICESSSPPRVESFCGPDHPFSKLGREVVKGLHDAERESFDRWLKTLREARWGFEDDDGFGDEIARNLTARRHCQLEGFLGLLQAISGGPERLDAANMRQAADCFRDAWAATDWNSPSPAPGQSSRHNALVTRSPLFERLFAIFPSAWHAGHWTVYDLLCRWFAPAMTTAATWAPASATWAPASAASTASTAAMAAGPQSRTVSLPVCVYNNVTCWGEVVVFHVELIMGESGPFLPCADRLGMTLGVRIPGRPNGRERTEEPDNLDFMASMQRAWLLSGVSNGNMRGRWWIERHSRYHSIGQSRSRSIPPIPLIAGRSIEAAACCAIWAAYGGNPASTRFERSDQVFMLDSERVVSAKLSWRPTTDGDTGSDGGGGELLLDTVEYLKEKATIMLQCRMFGPLLIATHPIGTNHTTPPYVSWRESNQERRIELVPLRTCEEAFDKLVAVNRLRELIGRRTKANWDQQWSGELTVAKGTTAKGRRP